MSQVLKLGITAINNQSIREVDSIEVIANQGIVGDRHFKKFNDPYNQLSLIESEGIDADYAQFREERDFPHKQVQYMQSLLQGLPLETQSYTFAQPTALSSAMGTAGGVMDLYNRIF